MRSARRNKSVVPGHGCRVNASSSTRAEAAAIPDRSLRGRGPISEADILWDLASRLEGRMTAIGMETFSRDRSTARRPTLNALPQPTR